MRTFVQQATQAEHKSKITVVLTEVDSNYLYLHMKHIEVPWWIEGKCATLNLGVVSSKHNFKKWTHNLEMYYTLNVLHLKLKCTTPVGESNLLQGRSGESGGLKQPK